MKILMFILGGALLALLAAWFILDEPTADPVPEEAPPVLEIFTFSCPNGGMFTISYSGPENEVATLSFSGVQHVLERAISASGARYASEDGQVVFWEHQGQAFVEIDGTPAVEGCTLV